MQHTKKLYSLCKSTGAIRRKYTETDSANDPSSSIPEKITEDWLASQLEVSQSEVNAYIRETEEQFAEKSISELLTECRQQTIQNIITPLGLGKFIALYDKIGGNVDTIHNVREGVYATQEEKEKYDSLEEYDSHTYHSDPNYIENNKKIREKRKQGELTDAYTGNLLEERSDQDHIQSANEIHNDPGRVLAELDGVALANADSNLVATNPSLNRSKGKKSVAQFIEDTEKKKEDLAAQIAALKEKEKNTGSLTDNQKEALEKLESKLEALNEIDYELMKELDEQARTEYNKTLNKAYYSSKKFWQNTAITSVNEAGKMGFQQAFGLFCYDLTNACFDELADCWIHGFKSGNPDIATFDALKMRLKRIGDKTLSNWKQLVLAFRDGALSGFLSNLITVFINVFMTTAKNIVRIIREGTLVLLRAAKTLLCPEKGLTREEVWDAALKILVTGALSVGGIALHEAASNIVPISFPGKDMLLTICIGILTGVSTAIVLYAIDKWDPFGAKDEKKRRALNERIQSEVSELNASIEAMCLKYGVTD